MNLVLADTEEFRRIKRRQNKPSAPGAGSGAQTVESEEKRTLGLTIVRGAHIISLSVESPPPADPSARLNKTAPGGISSTLSAGPGVAKPIGRGAAPASLAVSNTAGILSTLKLTCLRAPLLVLEPARPPVSLAFLELQAFPVLDVEVRTIAPGDQDGILILSKALLPASLVATFLLLAVLAVSPVLPQASARAVRRPLVSTLPRDDNYSNDSLDLRYI